MKLIPFYKIKYLVDLKTEAEIEKLLLELIKPEIQSANFLSFPDSRKLYQGELDIKKNEFSLIRNYGANYSSNIIKAKGNYRMNGNECEVVLMIRPDYLWLLIPFVLMIVGFIYGGNIAGGFILFILSYFLVCIIPANITGQRMIDDLDHKLRKHLIEKSDLTSGLYKF